MHKMLKTTLMTALLMGGLVAASQPATDSAIHFALVKSAPMADSSVASVNEIRLWFTEAPAEGTTSIRLVGAEDMGVHVADVAQDPDDDRAYFVALHGTVAPGTYSVAWRGMGADGHVVRETFEFTVTGQ